VAAARPSLTAVYLKAHGPDVWEDARMSSVLKFLTS
jgi:hypothetical protein